MLQMSCKLSYSFVNSVIVIKCIVDSDNNFLKEFSRLGHVRKAVVFARYLAFLHKFQHTGLKSVLSCNMAAQVTRNE